MRPTARARPGARRRRVERGMCSPANARRRPRVGTRHAPARAHGSADAPAAGRRAGRAGAPGLDADAQRDRQVRDRRSRPGALRRDPGLVDTRRRDPRRCHPGASTACTRCTRATACAISPASTRRCAPRAWPCRATRWAMSLPPICICASRSRPPPSTSRWPRPRKATTTIRWTGLGNQTGLLAGRGRGFRRRLSGHGRDPRGLSGLGLRQGPAHAHQRPAPAEHAGRRRLRPDDTRPRRAWKAWRATPQQLHAQERTGRAIAPARYRARSGR